MNVDQNCSTALLPVIDENDPDATDVVDATSYASLTDLFSRMIRVQNVTFPAQRADLGFSKQMMMFGTVPFCSNVGEDITDAFLGECFSVLNYDQTPESMLWKQCEKKLEEDEELLTTQDEESFVVNFQRVTGGMDWFSFLNNFPSYDDVVTPPPPPPLEGPQEPSCAATPQPLRYLLSTRLFDCLHFPELEEQDQALEALIQAQKKLLRRTTDEVARVEDMKDILQTRVDKPLMDDYVLVDCVFKTRSWLQEKEAVVGKLYEHIQLEKSSAPARTLSKKFNSVFNDKVAAFSGAFWLLDVMYMFQTAAVRRRFFLEAEPYSGPELSLAEAKDGRVVLPVGTLKSMAPLHKVKKKLLVLFLPARHLPTPRANLALNSLLSCAISTHIGSFNKDVYYGTSNVRLVMLSLFEMEDIFTQPKQSGEIVQDMIDFILFWTVDYNSHLELVEFSTHNLYARATTLRRDEDCPSMSVMIAEEREMKTFVNKFLLARALAIVLVVYNAPRSVRVDNFHSLNYSLDKHGRMDFIKDRLYVCFEDDQFFFCLVPDNVHFDKKEDEPEESDDDDDDDDDATIAAEQKKKKQQPKLVMYSHRDIVPLLATIQAYNINKELTVE